MMRPLLVLAFFATQAHAAEKPIRVFLLAGQSNMVGWGDSTKLPDDLRKGNDRVLMFEDGKWQPLRPHEPANKGQRRVGLAEFHFGPEIAFGHEMAKAWPEETIGIIKFAIGGTSVLAWKPDWPKEDADRVGQGKLGSLYKKLMEKVDEAKKARDIEVVGFLWHQGGGDMKKVDVARELSSFQPPTLPPGRPGAWLVLKAQFDAQKEIPHSKMVILRNIEKHPKNVHFNMEGQLKVGKLFAEAFLEYTGKADTRSGGKTPLEILATLGRCRVAGGDGEGVRTGCH